MQARKVSWSISDVAVAAGRSNGSANELIRRTVPPSLLEARTGRGAAVQLPESVAVALVSTLRLGVLNPQVIEAMKNDPASVRAAAKGLAELVRLAESAPPAEAA